MLLLEEHALVRAALRALLAGTPGLSVIGEAGELHAALQLARTHHPDVVLVNGRAAAHSSDEALVALRRAAPAACVLMLADDDGRDLASPPTRAFGCLPKDVGVPEFCSTIASLLGVRCSGCALRPSCPAPGVIVPLSRRERQVAIRVAGGLTSKQIAGELGLSLRTVHTYRESLARKLGASSAAVVTRYVIESGLTDGAIAE